MTSRKQGDDPNAHIESQKYDNPIASRQFILETLTDAGEPLSFEALAKRLDIVTEDQQEAFQRRLNAMTRDGQLVRNRKSLFGLAEKMDLLRGRVQGHRDGHGFLIPDNGGDDWFISPREMRSLFNGDRILARLKRLDRRGRPEAGLVEILEDSVTHIVGRYYDDGKHGLARPEDPRNMHDIVIDKDDSMAASDGQVVVVRLTRRPGRGSQAQGMVVEILGDYMAPGVEIQVAIRNHLLPFEWPAGVLEQTSEIPLEVTQADLKGRKDLRDMPLVTIDGADARDFDDAIYVKAKPKGGWQLWVAIADVSHYVHPDSPLDKEAINRGNSVYFPDNVLPMLPEVLSNGLCSLNPAVDRLCMVCEMSLDTKGELKAFQFYPAVMHSKARFTYEKVWKILDGDEQLREQYRELVPDLEEAYALFKARLKVRKKRGAIEFETTETQIVFNDQRKIEKIVPVVRNDAHKIIEECMILANISAARMILKHEKFGTFRVHEGPKEARLNDFRAFLGELGLFLFGGSEPSSADYSELLNSIKERPDAELIQTMLLRSMSQAVYQETNKGHFGLALEAYTHFTSPIRRYPDLLVHRLIKYILKTELKQKDITGESHLPKDKLSQRLEHCSTTERRADLATRDVVDWLKCEFMLSRLGEEYWGTVASVTSFGLFVRLDEVYVDGLIHISSLGNDYYHFDAAKARLVGERTRDSFRIGDRLRVSVAHVDLEDKKIDFELLEKADVREERTTGSERAKIYARTDSKGKDDKSGKRRSGKKSGGKKDQAKRGGKNPPKARGGKKKSASRNPRNVKAKTSRKKKG